MRKKTKLKVESNCRWNIHFLPKMFDETEVDRKLEEQIIKDFSGQISIFQDLL